MRHLRKILLLVLLSLTVYYFYPEKPLPNTTIIDNIVVDKSGHRMDVFSKGILMKSYSISLGRGEWGLTSKDWDNKTPTGNFVIDSKFTNSSFHKALTISYGNQIEIHGLRNHLGFIGKFHRWIDWTKGCIAVTDREVDELYAAVPIGIPITIQ